MPIHQYKKVALGGTFDHFHIGHRAFFAFAFDHADHVVVGVTHPKLTQRKKYAQAIESYEMRVQTLHTYFREQKYRGRYTVVPLDDVYGTTIADSTIEAIIVTPMTQKGAVQIHAKRREKKLPELPVHVCEMIRDENGEYVSSTRIREGNVNREGKVYRNLLNTNLQINLEQKMLTRNVGAKYVNTLMLEHMRWDTKLPIVVVGDVVTQTCIDAHIPFSLAYVDGYTKREQFPLPKNVEKETLTHPAGTVQSKTFDHIQTHMFDSEKIFRVQGEEDLIALEAVLALPLGSTVIYGNPVPPQSIAVLYITESLKHEVQLVLTKHA